MNPPVFNHPIAKETKQMDFNRKFDSAAIKAIEAQSFTLEHATVYVMNTPVTAAFSVRGELCVVAPSKLRKAERTVQIKDVLSRYRQGERLEVQNA